MTPDIILQELRKNAEDCQKKGLIYLSFLMNEAAAEIERLQKKDTWGNERQPVYDDYGQFTGTWR